jgi:hypothetical protein
LGPKALASNRGRFQPDADYRSYEKSLFGFSSAEFIKVEDFNLT